MKGLPSYCRHCGKPLTEKTKCKYQKYIHNECKLKRDKIKRALTGERWKKLMEDPEVIKKINKIDEEIIENIEHKNFYKKETKNNLFLQHENKRNKRNALRGRQQRAGKKIEEISNK